MTMVTTFALIVSRYARQQLFFYIWLPPFRAASLVAPCCDWQKRIRAASTTEPLTGGGAMTQALLRWHEVPRWFRQLHLAHVGGDVSPV